MPDDAGGGPNHVYSLSARPGVEQSPVRLRVGRGASRCARRDCAVEGLWEKAAAQTENRSGGEGSLEQRQAVVCLQ